MSEKRLVGRLGWRPEQVPLDSAVRMFEQLKAAESQYGTDMIKKLGFVERGWNVAYYAYVLEETNVAIEWAHRTGELAEDYFFGSWRDEVPSGNGRDRPPDRHWYDHHGPWVQPLQYGLLATLALGDAARTKQIAGFPFEDALGDHGVDAACDEFWLILTRVLRNVAVEPFAFPPESNKCNKTDQLLLQFLEGIARLDADLAQRAVNAYFKILTKTHGQGILLWLDSSILLHLAQERGLHLQVSDNVKDRIFRLGRLNM